MAHCQYVMLLGAVTTAGRGVASSALRPQSPAGSLPGHLLPLHTQPSHSEGTPLPRAEWQGGVLTVALRAFKSESPLLPRSLCHPRSQLMSTKKRMRTRTPTHPAMCQVRWRALPWFCGQRAAEVAEAMSPVPCFFSGSQAAYITHIPGGGREGIGGSG